ncbi:oxidoreductase domain protein [[Bacillus] selenitireducens MLS10]|uniref:Oxidoreductase domain protein n=1 Tax=Bacillus selenitireducens (strain ATCC 700615 / DSM 15326 / MLS10) TaxID=439292 RepID=D6XUM4_BACIE|nr:Gfo/Idh/MocA family oxidoreductase [Salisediminibacterium selenitireducens]ADH99510.1 oxidoreductase domain protein [[Bacillus] selenitireducens MLS10]
MTDKKVKYGILSTAKIAETQLVPALKDAKNAELYAVASQSGKEQAAATRWGAPFHYDNYRTLLKDPDIDAVYIPLPNSLHQQWAIEAMKNGKHVLLEKPAALKSDDIIAISAAAKEFKVQWMEAFMYQFHPQHVYVKQLLKDHKIGEVKRFRSHFSFLLDLESDNIRLKKSLGGGALMDIGCYSVHAARDLLQEEPIKVFSNARKLSNDSVDISSSSILTFEHVDAVIDCSFAEPPSNTYEIIGTEGSISVPHAFRPDASPDGGKGRVIVKDRSGSVVEDVFFEGNAYQLQVEHFSDCILNHKEPIYNGEQSYNNMRIIEALYQSQG